ncbi:MAG TPA: ABC transporter permease, partial [Planctomycetota bacterium]|nr:ABC transporter permease [Planctomycetota bacterium]
VIIAVAAVVSRVLAESKDQRTYAVLDRTEDQWLSQEVEKRALARDLDTLLAQQRARARGSDAPPRDVAELRARLQAQRDAAGHPKLAALIDAFLAMPDEDLARLIDPEGSKVAATAVLMAHLPRFRKALGEFDPAEIESVLTGLALAKYRRVPADDGDDPAKVEEALREKVNKGKLFAYIVLEENPAVPEPGTGLPTVVGRYVSTNLTDDALRRWYESIATDILRERRVAALALTREQANALRAEFRFDQRTVSRTGVEEEVDEAKVANKWAPVVFVYLLWIAVFSIAQMLLTNTVEEKSNRIIEVLLSSVSPHQLMNGKILGIAATGLTMIGSWVVFALIGLKVVDLDVAWSAVVSDPLYLGSFIGYFLAGYLIYAAVLVAIGSVCNSLKEAQNLMQPVILVLMVPVIAMFFVVRDPNGTVARILTYIPVYTPFLMMNRASGPPPLWEYVASTILILLTIAAAFWAAGRVFRVGILMTGKPPRIGEVLGWLLRGPGREPAPRREAARAAP